MAALVVRSFVSQMLFFGPKLPSIPCSAPSCLAAAIIYILCQLSFYSATVSFLCQLFVYVYSAIFRIVCQLFVYFVIFLL